jgi:hypothetical protein
MDAWYWPFVLILCSPIVTVPLMHVILNLSAHFSAAELEQQPSIGRWGATFFYLRDVRLAHMAGSMNLLAVAWLACPSAQTKLAAVLAGLLGAVRLAVPLLILEGASVSLQGDTYVPGSRMVWWSGSCSIGLWLLTAATLGLFGASSAIVAWLAEDRARRDFFPPGSS